MLTLFLLPLLLSACSGRVVIGTPERRTNIECVRSSVVLAKDCFVTQGYFDFRVGSVAVAAENHIEPYAVAALVCFFFAFYCALH